MSFFNRTTHHYVFILKLRKQKTHKYVKKNHNIAIFSLQHWQSIILTFIIKSKQNQKKSKKNKKKMNFDVYFRKRTKKKRQENENENNIRFMEIAFNFLSVDKW